MDDMSLLQPDLFDAPASAPPGFAYQPGLVSKAEAQGLQTKIAELDLQPFEFRGYLGKRRVIYFGWRYDFTRGALSRGEPIPGFLDGVRTKAAAFAGLAPERLEHVLINEYAPGAGIGWHRDRPQFEDVIAVSLGAPGLLRFRRRREGGWDRASVPLEPCSAYLLRGAARSAWEHSLPEVDVLRYSITFRTMPAAAAAAS
jgi:alkylated DNA repair dioxygenase AlkB